MPAAAEAAAAAADAAAADAAPLSACSVRPSLPLLGLLLAKQKNVPQLYPWVHQANASLKQAMPMLSCRRLRLRPRRG